MAPGAIIETEAPPVARVTTLELFFDLVFVFTITQLTGVLAGDPTPRGVLQAALMLGVIWWMYGAFAWLTNNVAADRASRRILLLGGMALFLVLALSIPHAFTGDGVVFGVAYLGIVLLHAGMFTRSTSQGVVRGILGIAPFNIASALLVLAAVVVGGPAEYFLWIAAFLLEWVTPWLAGVGAFVIGVAHFVERYGLVIIVAIGESVVAIGIGASGLPLGIQGLGVAVLGLALCACLWWVYFGGDDERAQHALGAAAPERRPALALTAYGYCHLLMLAGVIAVAAGLEAATAHPFEPPSTPAAAFLAGGTGLFLAADVLFRRALGIDVGWTRPIAAVLVLATIPLGIEAAATLQVAGLVAMLVLLFAVEARGPQRRHAKV